jgi:hypothetical protein
VLLLAAGLLPLPGVDQLSALTQAGRVSGWWAHNVFPLPPAFSLLSGGLLGLVAARAGLDLILTDDLTPSGRRLWTAAVAGLYAAGSVFAGIALGLRLGDRFPELVVGDGLLVAMLHGLAGAAIAGLLWTLSDLVRRSGIANGSLTLFLAWEGVHAVYYVLELLAAAWLHEPELLMKTLYVGTLPVALVFVALWRWAPSTYPLQVWRGLWIRGPLDLIAVPLVAGAMAGTFAGDLVGYPAWTPQPPIYHPGLVPRTLVALLCVPALAFWLNRQPGRPGGWPWLAGAGAACLLTAAMAAAVAL